jgi:hypothetical protein
MTKPESSGPPETETRSLRERSSPLNTELSATTRIDPPHESGSAIPESAAVEQAPVVERVADEPAAKQIRCQADQLASHLRGRQKELDYREAELNSRTARLESEARIARLWLDEREADIAARSGELAKQQDDCLRNQREAEKRLTRLAAAESAQQKRLSAAKPQQADESSDAVALATRQKQLDEAEARLTEAQVETQKLQGQLLDQQRSFAEETAAMREQMAAEHLLAMADLEQKRQAVQRRADYVDRSRGALKQLRGELGRMHRETLEIRLTTEELWAQLSGAAPPAALTRSLGRIRTKLAEQYRQANAELADQRRELEAIREQLVEQHEKLVEQKRQFEQWIAGREEQCQQQASRLVAREQQLHCEGLQLREQSLRWEGERMKYRQESRLSTASR